MNESENILAGKKLPLPSPRSPAQLDERVLAEARKALPRQKTYRQPWWFAGSAAAAVVVVAVTLNTTNLTTMSTPAYENIVTDSESKTEAARTTLEPRLDMRKASFESKVAKPSVHDAHRQEKRMPVAAAAVAAEAAPAPAAPSPATARLALEERMNSLPKSAMAGQAMSDTDADIQMHYEKEVEQLPGNILNTLQRLTELEPSSDNAKIAISEYEKLRASCRACGLPATLEEARKKYLLP